MIRLFVVIPFLLVLLVFCASNQDPQNMWLMIYTWRCSLGVFALVVSAIAFLIGAFCFWVSELGQRRRARKAEQRVKELEAQLLKVQAASISDVVPAAHTPDSLTEESVRT